MNDSDDGSPAAFHAELDPADEAHLEQALREVLAGDEPPDLRARILSASASELRAAAQRVDAAEPAPAGKRWLLAAVAMFAVLVVGGVHALQRAKAVGQASTLQEPLRELEVGNVEQLAAHLARTTTVALTALRGTDGARLPNEPEYSGMLSDPLLRDLVRALFVPGLAAGTPFDRGAAHAELRLQGEAGFVRLFVLVEPDAVRLGNAKFATGAVPAELAVACRAAWETRSKQRPPTRRRLQVHTQRELVAAIGNDRTIELVGGPFVLTGSDDDGELPESPFAEFRDPSPVPFLVLKGVRNLRLVGIGGPVRVLGKSPADVLRCEDCVGVVFEGLVLGHETGVAHFCSAPVLTLQRCQDVLVRGCELFGCGTEGIVGEQVKGLRMEHGEIHTCRFGVMTLHEAVDVQFLGVTFRDCELWQPGFGFDRCENVRFDDCVVRGLDGLVGGGDGQVLFGVVMDEAVQFVRGQIRGNRTKRVANSKLLLVRDGTDEGDNGPDVVLEPRDEAGGERR